MMKTFALGLVAAAATGALLSHPAEASVKQYTHPCQGVSHCTDEKTDGEEWMVMTPEKNWKKVIYRFHHLTKQARSVCGSGSGSHAGKKLHIAMILTAPGSSKSKTVEIEASGRTPQKDCF
ncbi:hypothetical protein ACIHFD_09850 [Nonomuraea sp. NPDC051941]|uniref:hypothetical protein n=1 Tax=unclassified Nonomuraea TaxID=2593643 RepID=UPI0033B6884E